MILLGEVEFGFGCYEVHIEWMMVFELENYFGWIWFGDLVFVRLWLEWLCLREWVVGEKLLRD